MTAFETIRVALESIIHNMLRSTLTMLGIIIGVAAVIAIVALITGAQRAVDEQISSLGAGVVSVAPGQSYFRGVASADRVSMTIDDYHALRRDAHYLAEVVPEMSLYRQIQYGNQNLRHRINGTTPNYPGVHGIEVAHGRMFSEGDLAARRRVAVLGQEIPVNLDIEPENIIGRMISIDRVAFQVIGVFEEVGLPWQNPDDDVFIPLSTAELRVFGSDRLDRLSAKVAEGIPLETGMVDIERVMRREHKIRPGAANDFMIMNPQQFVEAQQQSMAIFAFLLGGVASVSLVVGGIGVMNIMLVSVTERIREIGVRKALGGTRFNILTQFLTEALTIGTLGGLIGIGLGWGVAWAMAQLAGFNTVVSVEAVLLAFGVSGGIGLVFGVWPARRAAQLDPIEALRHD
ncbi:MAG: FtsX-like permease family protein [Gammaproteobacteria bacterium]|nr:FtsX-like permease family protein [Gammaproteobacteria bacterium]